MDAGIRAYYDRGDELERLTTWGWFELTWTKELLLRHLPPAPARVLDVGGGPRVEERLLSIARQVEQEPALLGASAHLLAIARKAGTFRGGRT